MKREDLLQNEVNVVRMAMKLFDRDGHHQRFYQTTTRCSINRLRLREQIVVSHSMLLCCLIILSKKKNCECMNPYQV